jgi:hypothetical protein
VIKCCCEADRLEYLKSQELEIQMFHSAKRGSRMWRKQLECPCELFLTFLLLRVLVRPFFTGTGTHCSLSASSLSTIVPVFLPAGCARWFHLDPGECTHRGCCSLRLPSCNPTKERSHQPSNRIRKEFAKGSMCVDRSHLIATSNTILTKGQLVENHDKKKAQHNDHHSKC